MCVCIVEDMAAGGEHSLVKREGQVWSAGGCGLGWCRLYDLGHELFGWRRVPILEPVVAMHAGYYHNLCLGASGAVFSWGCGTFVDGGLDGVIPALGQGPLASDIGKMPGQVCGLVEKATAVSGGRRTVHYLMPMPSYLPVVLV